MTLRNEFYFHVLQRRPHGLLQVRHTLKAEVLAITLILALLQPWLHFSPQPLCGQSVMFPRQRGVWAFTPPPSASSLAEWLSDRWVPGNHPGCWLHSQVTAVEPHTPGPEGSRLYPDSVKHSLCDCEQRPTSFGLTHRWGRILPACTDAKLKQSP